MLTAFHLLDFQNLENFQNWFISIKNAKIKSLENSWSIFTELMYHYVIITVLDTEECTKGIQDRIPISQVSIIHTSEN